MTEVKATKDEGKNKSLQFFQNWKKLNIDL